MSETEIFKDGFLHGCVHILVAFSFLPWNWIEIFLGIAAIILGMIQIYASINTNRVKKIIFYATFAVDIFVLVGMIILSIPLYIAGLTSIFAVIALAILVICIDLIVIYRLHKLTYVR